MTTLPSGDELDRLLATIQRQDPPELTIERRVIAAIGDYMLVCEETCRSSSGSVFEMRTVYTRDGAFVGAELMAEVLHRFGIAPSRTVDAPATKVCTIGFSESEQAWFGWSHRAICGFHLGFVVNHGHVVTDPSEGPNGEDVPGFAPGFTAATLDDCKALAIKFASEIQ